MSRSQVSTHSHLHHLVMKMKKMKDLEARRVRKRLLMKMVVAKVVVNRGKKEIIEYCQLLDPDLNVTLINMAD